MCLWVSVCVHVCVGMGGECQKMHEYLEFYFLFSFFICSEIQPLSTEYSKTAINSNHEAKKNRKTLFKKVWDLSAQANKSYGANKN